MSAKTSTCPKCTTPLPSDAPRGMCPECLLLGGFEEGDASESSSSPGTPRERTIHIVVPLDEPGGAVPETLRYFGDYELLEQIAVGGMGVVFKARQVSLNRLVAVKMIRAGQLAREDDIRRFRTEAEAAANLKHPHIVAIHEVGEHEGRHFFSMDYIEGRSLAELVRNHPLEPERAARLMQTIAEAIAYAHGRGVLHRDLKPSNVMIDAEGQPHVTDFGLAKMLTNPERETRNSEQTQTGAVMGSPSYMSPEQARGRGDQISVRSDVYALGAMLYELLTARPPFLAATALETMKLVAERDPVAPRVLNPSAPRDLETICLKCLQKEPAHRYTSAAALAEDLARWQRHEPIRARPGTMWEQAVKWARRHPARAGLVALSLVAPAVIIALLFFNERRVTRQRDRALTNEVFALSEARRAETNALTARQNLYAADLYVAAQFVEAGQLGPALKLLESHRPKPGETDLRGFEWRYLRAQCEGTQTRVLRGHKAAVRTLAFSPDGRTLASGDDARVLLWNTATWKNENVIPDASEAARFRDDTEQTTKLASNNPSAMLGMMLGSTGLRPQLDKSTGYRARATLSLAFSPDGGTLATSGGDDYLKFWDTRTRQLRSWIPESTARMAFLPGTNLAFVGLGFDIFKRASGETRLYDWAAGKVLLTLSNSGGLLALSADGRNLVTANWSGRVRRWDTATREMWASFQLPEPNIHLLAISPHADFVATCVSGRRQFHLWDGITGRWRAGGDGHRAGITALTFSPDSLVLATASLDATVRLWNAAGASELARLDGHLHEVHCLAYSPDGRTLAAGSQDGDILLWDVVAARREGPAFEILPPLVFSGDSRRLAGLNRAGQVALWDVDSSSLIPLSERTNLFPLFFNATGDTLILAARVGKDTPWQLERWDVTARAVRSRVTLSESEAMQPGFSVTRDHRRLAGFAANPGQLLIWDTESGLLERRLVPSDNQIRRVELSPDGRFLAVLSHKKPLELLDTDTGLHLPMLTHQTVAVVSAAFTPDSATLVTGGTDNLIRLWDTKTGALRYTLAGHGGAPSLLAVSPDGRTLASHGGDGTFKLWSMASGRELATLLRDNPTRAVAFSPDGRLLCAPQWGSNKLLVWRAPLDSTNPPAATRPPNQAPARPR